MASPTKYTGIRRAVAQRHTLRKRVPNGAPSTPKVGDRSLCTANNQCKSVSLSRVELMNCRVQTDVLF